MNLTRRETLAAAAGLFARGLGAAACSPQVSAQFYVWTQNFASRKISIGDGVEEAMAATKRAGYRSVELTSEFFEPAVREKTFGALMKNDLAMPAVYAGSTMHEEAAAEKSIAALLSLAETVRPAGTRFLITNPSPKPNREPKTDAELDVQARALNRLGQQLMLKRGTFLLLHHHDPEMADGAREWRHLLKNTAGRVMLCMDIHWAYRGGQDPLALLGDAHDRLMRVHLRNSKGGVWTEAFGDGDVDYKAVAQSLHGYCGDLVVELAYEKGTAITRSLEADLRLSREYTEKTFGLTRAGK